MEAYLHREIQGEEAVLEFDKTAILAENTMVGL
jgi:hypothetical protein